MDRRGARSDRWFCARLFHGPRDRDDPPRIHHHRADHAGRFDLRLPRHAVRAGRMASLQLPADEHSAARPFERAAGHGHRPCHSGPDRSLRTRPSRAVRLRAVGGARPTTCGARGVGRSDASLRAHCSVLWRARDDQVNRIPAVLLDTSVIIDGRILDIAKTGFVDMPLVILSSVLRELQMVADSADATRRRRGRRGLDVLTDMQKDPSIKLQVTEDDAPAGTEIDAHLVRMAKRKHWAIMTNDFNLNRIARLEGVVVLNLNELAQAMRPVAIPGEEIIVTVAREGKEPGQGVGSLDDGTMVVIQNGRRLLNQTITAVVTSVIQTSAGRMIFAEPAGMDIRRGNGRTKREETA